MKYPVKPLSKRLLECEDIVIHSVNGAMDIAGGAESSMGGTIRALPKPLGLNTCSGSREEVLSGTTSGGLAPSRGTHPAS